MSEGVVTLDGPLAWGVLPDEIDGAFFPPLVRDASVIMLASPHPSVAGRWVVKVRLGLAAPDGLTLHGLRLKEFDPAFGGRWNAGSNKRGGGTALPPHEYARLLRGRLERALSGTAA